MSYRAALELWVSLILSRYISSFDLDTKIADPLYFDLHLPRGAISLSWIPVRGLR